MNLTELLDAPASYTFSKSGSTVKAAFKDSLGIAVEVKFSKVELPSSAVLWLVVFSRKGSVELLNDSPTDRQNAVSILSTVTAIIIEFSKKYLGSFIGFTAKNSDNSRSKIYSKLVARLLPKTNFVDISKSAASLKNKDDAAWFTKQLAKDQNGYSVTILAKKSQLL